MRRGASPQDACNEVVEIMVRRQPRSYEMPCVVLAINKEGNFGVALTTGAFELWSCQDGQIEMTKFTGIR